VGDNIEECGESGPFTAPEGDETGVFGKSESGWYIADNAGISTW
jgi:hypothetical protein